MCLPNRSATEVLGIHSREIITSYKNLYTGAHRNFICKWQKLEIIQMSFIEWIAKQILVPAFHGTLLGNKKEKLKYRYTWQLRCIQGHYTEWGKKPISKVLPTVWFIWHSLSHALKKFFFLHGVLVVACGIQFPNPGSNLGLLHKQDLRDTSINCSVCFLFGSWFKKL